MRAALVDGAIDLTAVLAAVQASGTAHGATVLFVGTVREVNDGRAVVAIEYDAYRAMASRELQSIAREAMDHFGLNDVIVEHRLGLLALGEASVAVAAAHPHRDEAFESARFIVEELKRRVPIWKLEHYVDGTREWVCATHSGYIETSVGADVPSEGSAL